MTIKFNHFCERLKTYFSNLYFLYIIPMSH